MIKRLIIILLTALFIFSSINNASANHDFMLVTISGENCSSCQKLVPVINDLEYEYGTKITFITLDVSSKSSIEESKQIAEEYGISDFFNNKKAIPTVGIFCPGGKLEKTFIGETRPELYKKAIDNLLLNQAEICSL